MRQHWTLFILGVIIFFFPFLGFPPSWKTVFLFFAGFLIAAIALSFIMRERINSQRHAPETQHDDIQKG